MFDYLIKELLGLTPEVGVELLCTQGICTVLPPDPLLPPEAPESSNKSDRRLRSYFASSDKSKSSDGSRFLQSK
jgi:hypothetical protein